MKNTSKTIVFFGNERLATGVTTDAVTLRRLIDAGYNVAVVIANYASGAPSRNQRSLEIAEVASAHHIPVLTPTKPTGVLEQLRSYNAVAGVLVAYGNIIPQSVLDIFPRGIINIHPSLLPLYRGSTPIESAIIDGTVESGVSIMQLTRKMDAGPIYAQKPYNLEISDSSTKQHSADQLLDLGSRMLIEHLPAIIDGTLVPTPQDHSRATTSSLITKADGVINWEQDAVSIKRKIIAYAKWPRSRTTLGNKEIIITEVTVQDADIAPGKPEVRDGKLIIGCKKGALQIERLIPAGKKEMSASAFLAGYKV